MNLESLKKMIIQPKNLNVSLLPHQLVSIYNMEKIEKEKRVCTEHFIKETNIAINADISGYGKCFKEGTRILLFDGTIKEVQDIKIGDELMGDDSTPRKVLSLAQGEENMYTIHQNSIGDDYTVNESHILCLKMTKLKKIKKYNDKILIFYFSHESLDFKCKTFMFSKYKFRNSCVRNAKDFYKNLKINEKVDIEIRRYLRLPEYIKKYLKGYRTGINFPEQYIEIDPYIFGLHINNYKFIPYCYLVNSRINRLKLLSGILKSYKVLENNNCIIKKESVLSKNILFLIRSLGINSQNLDNKIIIKDKNIHSLIKPNVKYENIHFQKDNLCYDINIIHQGKGKYYGFTINGNHRFLLHDFTVTHNTLSMIGLILRDKMEWNLETKYVFETISSEAGGRIKKKSIKEYNKLQCTLVLVSQSIISQWKEELKNTPLSVGIVSSKLSINNIEPENYDVILVIPTMFNELIISYKDYAWKRFIFEEPGHLRIPKMKEIQAGFYWFVTATPNSISEMHSNCRNGFMKQILGSSWDDFETKFEGMIIRNDPEFVKSSFNMPPVNYEYHNCYNPILLCVNGFVSESIKNMIDAGNIEGVITYLGSGKSKNIILLVKQKKLEELEEIEAKIKIYTIRNDENRIKEWNERKSRINSQIQDLDNKFSQMLKGQCHICLEKLKSPVMEYGCQNLFCGVCIFKWLKSNSSCPLCRKLIDLKELIYITDESDNKNEENIKYITRPMTKLEKVVEIINNNKNGKFIIFSQFDNTFIPICKVLEENNIHFAQIKGTVFSRVKKINEFKQGKISVIFLNTNFNGAGINLQEASDIILYHDMNIDTQTQIFGRANRIGRKIPLKVHFFQVKV